MTTHLRQNLPLYGVLLALLAMLAVAVALGHQRGVTDGFAVNPPGAAAASALPLPPELAALPATAEDDAVITSQLPMEEARVQNASVAFAATQLAPAPPFRFTGSAVDRIRARDCLALAGLAEAGAGDADQRAVMQVILNRARHPVFAGTICGVVFQGSERSTGCQFTFTCDGSLRRTYSESLWRAARQRADEMLGGAVFQPVGNATHYHTDWVYPWWSPKLDKIAQVRTHLFFRWRGRFGTTAVWRKRYGGGEPDPMALRRNANAVERTELELPVAPPGEGLLEAEPLIDTPATNENMSSRSPVAGVHLIVVGPADRPATLIAQADALCPGTSYCQVYGWGSAADLPSSVPLSAAARRTLRFSFVPAGANQPETVFFDCNMFPDAPLGTCLPRTGSGRAVQKATTPARPGARPGASASSVRPPAPSPTPTATATGATATSPALKADADKGTLEVR